MLVIAGSADRLLPSVDEAERLKKLIPGCRSMVLDGHGHAPLFDGRVDMSEIIAEDPALEGVVFPERGEGSAVSEAIIETAMKCRNVGLRLKLRMG